MEASSVFALDAILVLFTAPHSFWLFFFVQSVFYRKLPEGCRTFFVVFWERVGRSQKMGKLQLSDILNTIVWMLYSLLAIGLNQPKEFCFVDGQILYCANISCVGIPSMCG